MPTLISKDTSVVDKLSDALKASTGDPPTPEDVLKKRGGASNWVSSSSDNCEPYAINIEISYDPPCTGEEDEIITIIFYSFLLQILFMVDYYIFSPTLFSYITFEI